MNRSARMLVKKLMERMNRDVHAGHADTPTRFEASLPSFVARPFSYKNYATVR
jgi:hypothetical protein